MHYKVAYGDEKNILEAEVNALIREGYVPHGPLVVCTVEGTDWEHFYQAMVLESTYTISVSASENPEPVIIGKAAEVHIE